MNAFANLTIRPLSSFFSTTTFTKLPGITIYWAETPYRLSEGSYKGSSILSLQNIIFFLVSFLSTRTNIYDPIVSDSSISS
jgi:hypothetical protein